MQRTVGRRGHGWLCISVYKPVLVAYLSVTILASGCRYPGAKTTLCDDAIYGDYADRCIAEVVGQSENPDTNLPTSDCAANTPAPRTLLSDLP